ncbi:MAG: histidine kinase [Cellulophaga sp.]
MVKYNGHTFKTFTTKEGLPNNDVWEAFTTPDEKIWYLSKASKLGYIKNDTIVSFPNEIENEIINPLFTSQIKNKIYPTGPKKTFQLKEGKWRSIVINNLGNKLGDKTKIHHPIVAYLNTNSSQDSINVINKNHKIIANYYGEKITEAVKVRSQITDSLFFWISETKYSVLNLNTLKLKQFNFKDQVGLANIKYARVNLVNNELQISGEGFVGYLDETLNVKNPYYFPLELNAHFGFIDKTETIWLSTFNNGIYKLPNIKRKIKYVFSKEKIQSFDIIDESLIIGIYNKGFYKYNKDIKNFERFLKDENYIFGASEIEDLDRNYFFSTKKMLYFSKERKTSIDITATGFIAKKLVYSNNTLYGNYSFGVNAIHPKTHKTQKEYTQKGCNDILEFNNRLLVATTNGLKEIKNNSVIAINFKSTTFYKSILSIKKISTSKILLNTDGYGAYISDLQTIEQLKGSEFLSVQDAFLKKNTIWLATNSGVLKFSKENKKYQLKKVYNKYDGLPTNNINTIYVNDKELIVGTNNGIAILPKEQKTKSPLLDVYIKKATFNTQTITKQRSNYKYQKNSTTNFTISTINFSDDYSNFAYSYKLEPIQKEWIDSKTRSFNFNSLKPNNYTLAIKSGAIEKRLNFTIQPLFWQTFWFKLLLVSVLVFILVFATLFINKKIQVTKSQKVIKERELAQLQLKALRSQMNPHFVFNSLAAIQYYINENDFKASEIYLVKFSKLIRQFFEFSKENETTLDVEIALLENYLDIEKLRFKEKLDYKITIDPNLNTKGTKIPTMLLQPIVENAVNHGIFNKMGNGLIIINFTYKTDSTFYAQIMDDGVGILNTEKKSSTRIKSSNVLKDRIHYLNQSEFWNIFYTAEEMHPKLDDKGNKSIFKITRIS